MLTFYPGQRATAREFSGSGSVMIFDEDALRAKLVPLLQEHRDLDDAIQALLDKGAFDQLQIQRLKKRKLLLKDQITRIEDMLLPDIIA